MLYNNNGIFCAPNQAAIDEAFKDLLEATDEHLAFKMIDKGELADYLAVKINRLSNGLLKLMQPHLIQQVIDELGFNSQTGTKKMPALLTIKLNQDPDRGVFS